MTPKNIINDDQSVSYSQFEGSEGSLSFNDKCGFTFVMIDDFFNVFKFVLSRFL